MLVALLVALLGQCLEHSLEHGFRRNSTDSAQEYRQPKQVGRCYSDPMTDQPTGESLEQLLAALPDPDGPPWTAEETQLSTPYSDRETWARVLMWQLVAGESRYRGPPGLRDEMAQLLAATGSDEMRDRLLEGGPLSVDGR